MAFAPLASDGQPVFLDGLSRRQWLEATKEQRKAEFINALLHPADDDDWDFVEPTQSDHAITASALVEVINTLSLDAIYPDELAKRVEE